MTRLVCCALALLGVFGCESPPGPTEMHLSKDADGQSLYLEACAACHGAGGRGDGPIAAELKNAPPDLTLIAARRGGNFNGAEIRELVDGRLFVRAHGSREMPVWGARFGDVVRPGDGRESTPRQMTRRIVDYLETIQRPDPGGTR